MHIHHYRHPTHCRVALHLRYPALMPNVKDAVLHPSASVRLLLVWTSPTLTRSVFWPMAATMSVGSAPPIIPALTTPLGVVQMMFSMLSLPASPQGTPPPHPTHASPMELISNLIPML